MKSNVIIFKPLENVSAEENVRLFIDFSKNELTVFGADLDWDSLVWDISQHVSYRGNKGRQSLVFSNYETATRKNHSNKVAMSHPFCDFAKAYIRYAQAINTDKQSGNHLMALRVLEKALRDFSSDGKAYPENISPDILNQVIKLLKGKYKNPYAQANALEKVSDFICENKMAVLCLPWKNPIKYADSKSRSATQSGVDYSKDKCPTDACIRAVAKIFSSSESPVDQLASSTAVVQFANPCRIGEVLTMPADCEVEDIYGQNGGYALKIIPEKTDQVMVKDILGSWIDLTKEAVKRLKKITETGREMAKWYEEHPDRMYLPEEYRDLKREEFLPSSVVKELLGIVSKSLYNRFIKDNNISLIRGKTRKDLGLIQGRGTLREAVVRHSEVSKAVCALLPGDFPFIDRELKLKYSEALFVVPWNFFRREKFFYSRVMFQPVTFQEITTQYGSTDSKGMFDWNKLFEDDGSKIVLNTHAPRHWQNTIANYNHVPELFIALWSGKFHTKQNEPYDNRSDEEKYEQVIDVLGDSFIVEAEAPSPSLVYMRPGFIASQLSQFGSFQVTEAGWCAHDFTMSPCRKMGDSGIHLCCSEHFILKGDPRNKLLRKALEEEEVMLDFVETEANDDSAYGVDVWHVFHRQRFEILKTIIDVLDDSQIPDGSFFRLIVDNEYSPQKIAVYNKTGKVIGSSGDKVQVALVGQYNFHDGVLALGT